MNTELKLSLLCMLFSASTFPQRDTIALNKDWAFKIDSLFDWANDGGLIRQVALIVSDRPAAAYIHAEPELNVENNAGKIKIRLGFEEANKNIRLQVKITEENQSTHQTILTNTAKPV
ncbi:hypothetical protein [Pedobacter immunditicola]|uniref:hypothetical protein n=1 Tax=Pedobacter immunditicola TaxID=3133440 RepID=UPI0030B76A7F